MKLRGRTLIRLTAVVAMLGCIGATSAQASGGGVKPRSGSYVGIGGNWFGLGLQVHRGFFGGKDKFAGNILWHGSFAGCPATGAFDGDISLGGDGRVHLTTSNADTSESLAMHFVSPSKVRGKFTYVDNAGSCAGSGERKFVLHRFGKGTEGHSGKPADGRYAGAGPNAYVWFDVVAGSYVDSAAYVQSFFSNCGHKTDLLPGSDKVGGTGQFSIYDSEGADAIVLGGRFTTPQSVTGKVLWNTPDNCPAGTSKFPYTAARMGPLQ